ncbi:MAG: putative HlyD family secretion protein [Firmicutes bacterium]|nr:putative HlyD family secretion protein [Bacillota bacterium]
MDLKKKTIVVGLIFFVLLFIGGMLLVLRGHDAVALAIEKKEGILTAEQVKLAFENVGGRLVTKQVQESQEVKKGDILMVLDSTDVDLSIQRLQTQINQMDAKIGQMSGSIAIDYAKTSTAEEKTYRQIEQQKAALDAAKATYDNQQLNYNRKKALADSGAVSPSELDSAQAALDVASANVSQQQSLLDKMLAGSNAGAKSQVLASGDASNVYLPEIDQQRQTIANNQYSVQDLMQQKQNLLVQLKELQVKKDRLTLRAPEDGKVLQIIAREGEMVAPNSPVILLETKRQYYDIYVDELVASKLQVGNQIVGGVVANTKEVKGTIRFITAAPGFADLKMSREKGQADLAAFQIRIYVEPSEDLLPGMTIEVKKDAILKR